MYLLPAPATSVEWKANSFLVRQDECRSFPAFAYSTHVLSTLNFYPPLFSTTAFSVHPVQHRATKLFMNLENNFYE